MKILVTGGAGFIGSNFVHYIRQTYPDYQIVVVDKLNQQGNIKNLAAVMDDIEFHKGREPTTIMLRLRKLFQRAQPDERELRVLHGILADAQRMAQLAAKR